MGQTVMTEKEGMMMMIDDEDDNGDDDTEDDNAATVTTTSSPNIHAMASLKCLSMQCKLNRP